MAKITMKKRSSSRMSMKGGSDWKICRRFLSRESRVTGGSDTQVPGFGAGWIPGFSYIQFSYFILFVK